MALRVSVLMSVYNGERYLEEALESILNQTFGGFEFIIIDDGSSDSSPDLLARYRQRDPRIRLHRFETSRGLSAALNYALGLARGEYIARMDADDVSLPNRLQEQVAFMDAHPEIGICGTWAHVVGGVSPHVWETPAAHAAIHARLLFENSLVHPTVVMRMASIKQHRLLYDEQVRYAQDYEFWSRAVAHVRLANIEEPLLKYRVHPQAVGARYRAQQVETHEMVYRRLLASLSLEYSATELLLHRQIGAHHFAADIEFLCSARRWLERLSRANRRAGLIPADVLDAELGERWTQVCQASRVRPDRLWFAAAASPLLFLGSSGLRKLWRAARYCLGRLKTPETS